LVSQHQKGQTMQILVKEEMMGWQWHKLDHMQIVCTSLRTHNHVSTSSLNYLQAGCSSNSVKAPKAICCAVLLECILFFASQLSASKMCHF